MKKPQMQIWHWLVPLFVVSTFWLSSCSSQTQTDLAASSPTSSALAASPASQNALAPFAGLPRLQGKATVEMVVKGSPITIEVDGTQAPITAGNFVDLVKRGVYDGLVFHRVVREPQPFVVQGGDPQSKDPKFPAQQLGTGSFIDPATGQPRYIPLEITPAEDKQPLYGQTFESAGITKQPQLPHRRGAVAMARSSLPNSASSQFYIALSDLSFLDGNYAVFGYVTQGMEVVDKIQQGDRITSAKVTQGLENLKLASPAKP